ncbi:MAG: ATP-binding cassette domain-containing protein [Chlorobi bacterium]|nr:ATP-binding cassette domain-containing protein [Chlorobiota bacterium]
MNENAAVEIKDLSKKITLPEGAVKKGFQNLTADFPSGHITSVFSENKFSSEVLLKTISGIISPDSGSIQTKGEVIYIPAKASSFPWLTVKENILFDAKGKSEDEIAKIIEAVGLEGYEDHHCDNKSLGFRARIGLGRALIRKPLVIAVDDIFDEMDKKTKYEILELLRKISRETNQTFIIATGDVFAAIFVADEFYSMNEKGALSEKVGVTFNAERNSSLLVSEEFAETVKKVTLINK